MTDVAENFSGYRESHANPELDRIAQQHPLLGALDAKSLETVMGLSKVSVYRPKRTIVRAGEMPRYAYLLLEGTVRIFFRNDDGEELTTHLLRGPAVFNDARVLTESTVSETVVTLERTTLISIPAEVFRRLASLRPQFTEVLVRDQAERACIASEQQRHLAFEDIDTRLANLLIDYAEIVGTSTDEGFVRLRLAFSQQSMANDLGASRKSLNRALERLRGTQTVSKNQARYEIRDMEQLRERSSSELGIRHSCDGTTLERLQSVDANIKALE